MVQRFSKSLQQFMYVVTVNKQNRNQKIFSIIVLRKQFLPKLKQTAQVSLAQPDDIIIY